MVERSSPPAGTLEDFAAQIAHDFNNLLTGILGNLELLQHRAERNHVQGLEGYIEGASSASNRAAAFAQRLLAFSGRAGRPPERVTVDALLRGLDCMATRSLGAGDAAIVCDPAQLERAVAELLDNAAAATEARGEVHLTSSVEGEHIVIRVRDTGHGMAPDILARAPEPFFTTHANGAGKGLGLCIATRVAAQTGGNLEIESEEGAGCTATLRLPRAT